MLTNNVKPPNEADPSAASPETKRRLTRSLLTGLEKWERMFCETCMIVLTITEAAALITSSLFWLFMRANPSAGPGSPALPETQSLESMAIMLFGELVVTDGAVAYATNKFTNRYVVNLASAWTEFREERKYLLWYLVILMSFYSVTVVLNLPTNMCFTSPITNEMNWALTSCPGSQSQLNINEFARVSAPYETEWLEATTN